VKLHKSKQSLPKKGRWTVAQREENIDWVEQIPRRRFRGPYEDYGWEARQSILPKFRDPSTHEMPYDRPQRGYPGRRSRYEQGRSRYGRGYEIPGDYDASWSYTETWQIPGPATGRGPRGYQRSDERIHEEVCERLTQHGLIDASDIMVRVSDNEVTLTGTIDSRRTKRMAEDVADSVSGVRDVHNQLRVRETASQRGQAGGQERREIGQPGGGQGRVDQVGRSGVYPASGGFQAPSDAEAQGMASWGQGERGAKGYEDHGDSEIWLTEEERRKSQSS
jgi:hypothetical protein